jgi:hypothetical protein
MSEHSPLAPFKGGISCDFRETLLEFSRERGLIHELKRLMKKDTLVGVDLDT